MGFISRHRRVFIGGLVILNFALVVLFEWWRPRIGLTYDGLWNARTGVFAGLLLLDNLVVLWWYARRTEKQYTLALSIRREANKPIAVLDRKRIPEREQSQGEHVRYVVRNIGQASP